MPSLVALIHRRDKSRKESYKRTSIFSISPPSIFNRPHHKASYPVECSVLSVSLGEAFVRNKPRGRDRIVIASWHASWQEYKRVVHVVIVGFSEKAMELLSLHASRGGNRQCSVSWSLMTMWP